ncbi:MAG: hypothetical protein KAR21_16160 [Spirochaetales bacterium]|nr:hypothetical protein [Spirochaetales bacterium]
MKNEKLIIWIITLLLLIGGTAFSQEIVTDEDSLFGIEDDDMFSDNSELIEEVADDIMEDLSALLLRSDTGVEIGGDFFFDLTAEWKGIDPDDFAGSDISDSLSLDLGASIFLDARPDEDSRVFAKAVITAPFYTIKQERFFEDVITINELFADFNWDNEVFFRAGKQTVNWGVGYFFSPADLLSLSRIDPEAPDAELDGPIALKVNYPSLLNNYYLYTVVSEEVTSFSDVGIAPMVEFVIGSSEISAGAWYQYDKAPTAMTTISSAIGDVSIYGEGYLSYGSEKTFVISDGGGGVTTATYDDTIFFKGTVGASYSWSDDLSNFNLIFDGQYYYNGEGYEDPDIIKQYILTENITDPAAIAGWLMDSGFHYGAVGVRWREMWGSDFTFSLFFIENFSNFSGMIKPAISWGGLDNIDVTLSLSRMFGAALEEYSPGGNTAAVSLGVSIGGTSF